MNKLGIIIDNLMPFYENKLLLDTLDKLYKEDKNVSISLFARNVDWPYRTSEYGLFKLLDYQGFEGHTIVTNLELLDFIYSVPHNNQVSLYCFHNPFIPVISGKNAIKLLTEKKFGIYCYNKVLFNLMNTFRPSEITGIDSLIKRKLYDKS